VGNSDLRRLREILEIRAPGLFLPSPDLYSWRVSYHLETSFIRVKPARVSVIQWAPHSVGNSDLRRLRGILEIRAPGLFLPSPDLYSWRVSDHLEISFIRVKPARVSVIQWGTPFSGEFRSTEFESGFGNLDIWVFLAVARSINWHIY
jgi:hypothetical protein